MEKEGRKEDLFLHLLCALAMDNQQSFLCLFVSSCLRSIPDSAWSQRTLDAAEKQKKYASH